jgi:hypothetical protein
VRRPVGRRCELRGLRGKLDSLASNRIEQRAVKDRPQDAHRILAKQRTGGRRVEAAKNRPVGTPHLAARRDAAATACGIGEAERAERIYRVLPPASTAGTVMMPRSR